jgi:repressor LexA
MMARKRAKGLSPRQIKILEVLERYHEQVGYPPSIRDICDKTGITSTSVVNYYLKQLESSGFIERDGGVSRGIRLVKPLGDSAEAAPASLAAQVKKTVEGVQQAIEDILRIPVMGRIVAGSPVPVPSSDFSLYDADTMVDVARSLLPARESGSNLFALEVQGDSMIDAMVNEGDIVIMKSAQEARNGEMVAVWLTDKDETTLKYFYLENGRVRLQPANPTMLPIFIEDPSTVKIQGKVIMVIRQLQTMAS